MDSQVESFHQTLHVLSSRISTDTLDGLKYMCQDVLSEAQMNHVKTALDLFKALEENGTISAVNTEYLVNLLMDERKPELVKLLDHGSIKVICEESNFKNTSQQLVSNQRYPSEQFRRHDSLHNNEAASPLYVSEPQYHPRNWSSWQNTTREVSALEYSGSQVHGNQFAPLDPVKTPGNNQWQRQLGGNTYNEQLSNTSQTESLRYRSESVSGQAYQESYVSTNSEAYHSAPSSSSLRIDEGWQPYGNQIQLWSNTSTFGHQLPLSTPVENDDTTAVYAGSADVFFKESNTICELQQKNHQLTQEVNILRGQCEQMQQEIGEMQQREQERARAQYISIVERYQMDKSPHGIAVIISNHSFHSTHPGHSPMRNRRGAQVDEDNLHTLWKYLGYDVVVLNNRFASELLEDLCKIATLSHSNYDSFVCCILTHGYRGGVYSADGQPVELNTITNLFEGSNCPSLIGKPKMFFIQACRGEDEDKGVFPYGDEVEKDGKDDSKSLPSNADFLLAYSTASGMVSYRSEECGSWYISILCEVLKDHAHSFQLLDMLTFVNNMVSKAYTSKGFKQCPAPVHSLCKQVWFFSNHSYA